LNDFFAKETQKLLVNLFETPKNKMSKQVLFIQGGGEGGHAADLPMVDSLRNNLGPAYTVEYPELQSDESAPDFGWIQQISDKVSDIESNLILVGHSLGASMILKFLTEHTISLNVKGVFLISTPFWSGNEEWKTGLKLKKNFADKLPTNLPFVFYHCKDDEEVPFDHFNIYKKHMGRATFREIKSGGHLLDNDLTVVADDIKTTDF
jgi:predicted alpha/beta hydrolase family esterase